MRRRLSYLLAAAVILAVAVACQPDDEETIPVITVSQTILPSDGGSQLVQIAATSIWTISVEYTPGQEDGWIHFSTVSGSGFGSTTMTVDANEGDDSRQAVVHVRSPRYSASASVGQAAVPPPYWLELPARSDKDGLEMYVHDMKGGQYVSERESGLRNWTCYWDGAEHLSLWVAYPLTSELLKKVTSRSDDWSHFDPLVPQNEQPDLRNGSYGGGWTRGHQLPSADRLNSVAANVSTFYPTNMTPQNYDFNCEIWADLEGKVRYYANHADTDTLYVVTGCLYKDSDRKTMDHSGFKVKVPTHYFKALLMRSSRSAYSATGGFMAAGYLLPHDSSIAFGDFRNYICSIDELEKDTGINFFPNLTILIGADKASAVEAAEPSSWWK